MTMENNRRDEEKLIELDDEIARLRERRKYLDEEQARLAAEIAHYYQILMTEFTKRWQPLKRDNWQNNEF